MALTDIDGPGGGITLASGFNIHSSGWTAQHMLTEVDTTGFAENGNRTFDGTCQHLEGTMVGIGQSNNGTANSTSSSLVPTAAFGATPSFAALKGAVTLTATTGTTWAFTALIHIGRMDRRQDGKYDVELAFKSSGPITPSSF